MTIKQQLAIEIYKIVRIHCEVVSIWLVNSEKLTFRSQHTNCVTNCDDHLIIVKTIVNEQRTVVPNVLTIGQAAKI